MTRMVRSYWTRIAGLVARAEGSVKSTGHAVLIKFDGQRENGEIYTVLVDGDLDSGPRFRTDTSDLEGALNAAFPAAEGAGFYRVDELVELLHTVNASTKHRFFVALRIERVGGASRCDVASSGPERDVPGFHYAGDDMLDALARVVEFLAGAGCSSE
jgi:hypothetical protein